MSNIKGQNGEEGRVGTTSVLALYLTKYMIALAGNAGTNQFMSLCQFELSASTPKVSGFQ
jgi:hypothetical protein